MTRFKCLNPECGKVFVYAAKLTFYPMTDKTDETEVVRAAGILTNSIPLMEKHVCPYCHQLDFEEFKESQPEIIGAIKVELQKSHYNPEEKLPVVADPVAEFKKLGYEVKETYSGHVLMVKYSEVKQGSVVVISDTGRTNQT